jgi:hypothetical protein
MDARWRLLGIASLEGEVTAGALSCGDAGGRWLTVGSPQLAMDASGCPGHLARAWHGVASALYGLTGRPDSGIHRQDPLDAPDGLVVIGPPAQPEAMGATDRGHRGRHPRPPPAATPRRRPPWRPSPPGNAMTTPEPSRRVDHPENEVPRRPPRHLPGGPRPSPAARHLSSTGLFGLRPGVRRQHVGSGSSAVPSWPTP